MPDVLYEKRDEHVVDITLNRPEARNAYSDTMVDELVGSLDRAEDDPDVHAVVLSGAGESFSAGGDLKAMRDRSGMFEGDPVDLRNNYRRGLHRVPRRFDDFEKPVVAAIDGPAIGAGLDLALMCDLRIAAESATFGSTFARVGVVPGDGGAYLLARAVGFSTAVELILTARLVDADEALDIDLVHRVVEDGEVDATAHDFADRIASLPPKAVQTAKAALYQCVDRDLNTSLDLTAALQAGVQRTDEHDEAVREVIESLHGSGNGE